jgi:hypothetical protein
MLRRIAISLVVGAALLGVLSTGMLARHAELRRAASELLRLDVGLLVGG